MIKFIAVIFIIISYITTNIAITEGDLVAEIFRPEIIIPIKKTNLSCYHCDSFSDTETCIHVHPNRTKRTYCPESHQYCVVRQFSFLTNGTIKLWYLERTCKDECESYCLGMGEKIRLFSCTKCCQSDRCNSGSGSQTWMINKSRVTLFILFAVICLIICKIVIT